MVVAAAGPPVTVAADVLAGGGVVWRRRKGEIRILVVHRPRYDDWTFPKGKVDDGEKISECALREVEEETGYRCELGEKIATMEYTDNKGRLKQVRYWLMEVVDGDFEPNDEVDEVRWSPPGEAARLLTYERDVPVLDAALARLA